MVICGQSGQSGQSGQESSRVVQSGQSGQSGQESLRVVQSWNADESYTDWGFRICSECERCGFLILVCGTQWVGTVH